MDRGLAILDHIIKSGISVRYKDIKAALPGISDASLNRLLKTLIEGDYLVKDPSGKYAVTDKVRSWKSHLGGGLSDYEAAARVIRELAMEINESAALAVLEDDRIEIIAVAYVPDSYPISAQGSILPFDPVNAASAAILDSLNEEERDNYLSSRYGSGKSDNAAPCRKEGYYMDEPGLPPGMVRLAVSIRNKRINGAVYLKTHLDNLENFLEDYLLALNNTGEEILRQFSDD